MLFRGYISVFLLVLCVNAGSALAETIQLGAVLQLSGSQSEWGNQAREGADVAVELINESNLLSGRRLEILYEDGRGAPNESVTALRRLISINKIQAFLTQASPVTMSLAPISNSARVIQLDVGSTTPAYRKENDYTFRTAVTALQLAGGLAKSMIQKFKLRSCAMIYVSDDYGEGVRKVFRNRFQQLGGKVLAEETFLPIDSEFKTQLLRIRKLEPPAVVITARYDKLGTILKQAKSLGLNTRFFGDVYSVESEQVLRVAGEAADGFTYVAPQFSMERTAAAQRFTKRFRKMYGRDPVQLSAQAHDAVFAIAYAAKSCRSFESTCLKEKLAQVSFDGASGRLEFDDTGDVKSRPVEVRIVKGGRFVVHDGQE